MARKESKMNFNHLLDRFNIFSDVDTIQKLETYYLPKMKNFSLEIIGLLENNLEIKQVVQDFDAALCLKVNNSAFTHLQNALSAEFISKTNLSEIDAKFQHFSE